MEDGSTLRRGKPSTHTIFGAGQTVNAANYQIIHALEEVQKLGDKESVLIFTGELPAILVLVESRLTCSCRGIEEPLYRSELGSTLDQ